MTCANCTPDCNCSCGSNYCPCRCHRARPVPEPIDDTVLRVCDFAWQSFQAGIQFARSERGRGEDNVEAINHAFREWWDAHPQVKR